MILGIDTHTIISVSHRAVCTLLLTLCFSVNAHAEPRQQLADENCINPHGTYACTVDALWQKTTQWLNAWADHDAPAYFSFYAPEISPIEKLSYSQWQRQREQRVSKQTPLKLGVNFLDAQAVEGRKVRVLFIQHYDSGNYRDIVLKTLVYQLIENEFFIVEEIVHQTLSKQDAETILSNIK